MPTTRIRHVVLVLVALAAVDLTAGCVAESDPGANLNPQPLPPEPPPDDGTRQSEPPPDPGAFSDAKETGGGTGSEPASPKPDGGH